MKTGKIKQYERKGEYVEFKIRNNNQIWKIEMK